MSATGATVETPTSPTDENDKLGPGNPVRSSVTSVMKGLKVEDDNEEESEEEESEEEDSSEDEFDSAHSPSSPPAPRSRSLTRMSHSTVSSVPEPMPTDGPSFSPTGNRSSQASITPATTTNGSVQEPGFEPTKSPSVQRRISAESLDEVSLMDDLPPSKDATPAETSPPPPQTPSLVESIANRFSRSSVTIPTTTKPNPPPRKLSSPVLPVNPPQPPAPPPTRRSPFSWLRSSTSTSPPPTVNKPAGSRRATASSITSAGDLAELPRAVYDPEKEKEELKKGMENLRENFKRLREAKEHEGAEELSSPVSTPAADVSDHSSTKTEDDIDWDLWQAVVDDGLTVASEKPAELNKAIQAGIPPTLRGVVWQSLAASKSLELESIYREVIALPGTATAEDARPIYGSYWLWDPSPAPSQASSPKSNPVGGPGSDPKTNGQTKFQWGKTLAQLEKIIKRDLGDRTSFGKYKVDQKALLNLCKAYAVFDPAVGYTQGMTFIATVLLLNMSEEEAFCVFVKLMNKYKLRTMFQEKMKGLQLRLYQYDRILEDYEPRLAIHLKRQNIESSLYAAQWFLTLFTYKFPLQLVTRVFDLILSEGIEAPILQFGIVLMQKNAKKLLELEFDTLGPYLKERLFDIYIDSAPSPSSVMEAGFFGNGGEKEVYRANELVTDACAVRISQDMLERYEKEWDEIERGKRETELEIEGLKRNNASMQNKIRKLEEQNEDLNREYVRIASSEVTLKVQNDQLADENEVLKAKVEGLSDMVDKQPQEVEDRLKGEMDQLMQKNLRVHQENQELEQNLMEMEQDLVKTKMHLATLSQEHQELQATFQNLKHLLKS